MANSLDPEKRLWRFYDDQLPVAAKFGLAETLRELVIAALHPTVNGRQVRKPSIPAKFVSAAGAC